MSQARTRKTPGKSSPDAGPDPLYPTSVRWLYGGRCFCFKASFRFGNGGVHDLRTDVTREELLRDAQALRAHPHQAHHAYLAVIRRGRSQQAVLIPVPRAMMLGIADAIAGAADDDDAGHRFWHWENPGSPRPCSGCRDAMDAEDAKVDQARSVFLARWAQHLSVPLSKIEEMIEEYRGLPTKKPRP